MSSPPSTLDSTNSYFVPAGAAIVGCISDHTVINWKNKRGGVWYPEDRLRAAVIAYAIIVPIPLLVYGLANQFVDGTPGLVICLVCLFINGIGVSLFLQPPFGPSSLELIFPGRDGVWTLCCILSGCDALT